MNAKEMIEIVDTNGNNTMVELITYLISDDRLKQYIVYTKGEIKGEGNDQVIYISKLFKDNKIAKITNVVALIIMIVTVIGRLLSGVHWFTDILGGIIIASALLMSYYTVLDYLATNKTNITENE